MIKENKTNGEIYEKVVIKKLAIENTDEKDHQIANTKSLLIKENIGSIDKPGVFCFYKIKLSKMCTRSL